MLLKIFLQVILFITLVSGHGNFPSNSTRLNYEECPAESDYGETIYGVCKFTTDCILSGGNSRGGCGLLSTCCTYENGCGKTTSAEVSYFEGIPSDSTNSPVQCDYKIKFSNSKVCQLRLDLEEFQLAGSTSTLTSSKCDVDFLEISPNVYNIPSLCGNNDGQHVYIHAKQSEVVTSGVQLSIFLTGRANRPDLIVPRWKIKVTQLECTGRGSHAAKNSELLAPDGAIQYFTALSGTVRSFGFDKLNVKNSYTDAENYAIAFKKDEHTCGIRFTIDYLSIPTAEGKPNTDDKCIWGYLFVPNLDFPTHTVYSRLCSSKYRPNEVFTSKPPGPISINFISYPYQEADQSPNAFNLKYELLISC